MDWTAFGAIATGIASMMGIFKLSDSIKKRERERANQRHEEALANEQRHTATEHRLVLLETEFHGIAEAIRQELHRTNEALRLNNNLLEEALSAALTAVNTLSRKRSANEPKRTANK